MKMKHYHCEYCGTDKAHAIRTEYPCHNSTAAQEHKWVAGHWTKRLRVIQSRKTVRTALGR